MFVLLLPRAARLSIAALASLAVAGAGLAATAVPAAAATPALPATVSADPLPTVQINGVVWSQVVVGDTVYATGDFSTARPAGAPAGTNEVTRGDLLAYDITTGVLDTGFVHDLNGRGLAVTASPDGSRVYVGGDFTTVDGAAHSRLAAFDTATGGLVTSFTAGPDNTVRALAATDSTVYVGGDFHGVGGSARLRLAAFDTAGSLLAWDPGADDAVNALVVSPDGSRLVAGGRFAQLAGAARYGIGAVSAATGAATTWSTTFPIRDAGLNSAITSLSADGSQVYGTGYRFGSSTGNFEGRFALDPNTGVLAWMNDCHGDSYSALPIGQVLYAVSHSHDCSNIGGFPEVDPRTVQRAVAETTYRTGTVLHNSDHGSSDYTDFFGQPAGSQLNWYPDLLTGKFTGQGQAAWSVTGNAQYVSLGGEFPGVNNKPQQGLVRFAVRSIAPNKVAPTAFTTVPSTAVDSDGDLVVTWKATSDRDDASLTYRLYRDGTAGPIATETIESRFWSLPTRTATDTGLPTGTYRYRVSATDPAGNVTTSDWSPSVSFTANPGPRARFTSSCSVSSCSFDAGTSTGQSPITSYRWSFGDGATATGSTTSHTYATGGSYTVTLTVTDADGRTGTRTLPVTVSSPPASTLGSDSFQRTVSSGWGNAPVGGSWSALGSSANLSVSPGKGLIKVSGPGAAAGAALPGAKGTAVSTTATVSVNKIADGSGTTVTAVGRRVGSAEYRALVRVRNTGSVGVSLVRYSTYGVTTVLAAEKTVTGLTTTAGGRLKLRFDVTGTSGSTLRAKAWKYGASEPTAWALSATDAYATLQTAGGVGLRASRGTWGTTPGVAVTASAFSARTV